MAFCVSIGVDKKDSATVFGVRQPRFAVQLYSAEESTKDVIGEKGVRIKQSHDNNVIQ